MSNMTWFCPKLNTNRNPGSTGLGKEKCIMWGGTTMTPSKLSVGVQSNLMSFGALRRKRSDSLLTHNKEVRRSGLTSTKNSISRAQEPF
jgi:hypothetical protein